MGIGLKMYKTIFISIALVACAFGSPENAKPGEQALLQTETKPADAQFYGALPWMMAGGALGAGMFGRNMGSGGAGMPQPMQLPNMNMGQMGMPQGMPGMNMGQMGGPQGMPPMPGMNMGRMGAPQGMPPMMGAPQGMPMMNMMGPFQQTYTSRLPNMMQMPGMGGMAGMGGMGGIPGFPNMGALPGMGGIPNMIQLPGSPGMEGMGGLPNFLSSLPNNDASISQNHMLLQAQANSQANAGAGAGAGTQFYGAASPLAVGAGIGALAFNPYLLGYMAPYMLLGGLF